MAYENMMGQGPWTAACATGLRQYRFIGAPTTAGVYGYPTAGLVVDGVIRGSAGAGGGTTASTVSPQYCEIYPMGSIVKVEASASTLSVGDLCAASSVGYAVPSTAGDNRVGRVVAGSSGAANRVLSVLMINYGTTST